MQGRTFEPPAGPPGYQRQLARDRRPYQTLDGYICALIYNDKQWESTLRLFGRDDIWQGDARFRTFTSRAANIDMVYGFVAEQMSTRTTAECMELFAAGDVPFAPLHNLESIFDDPHLTAVGFFTVVDHPDEGQIRMMAVPDRYSTTVPQIDRLAPRLGEHTVAVLKETGYNDARIAELLERKVCADPAWDAMK